MKDNWKESNFETIFQKIGVKFEMLGDNQKRMINILLSEQRANLRLNLYKQKDIRISREFQSISSTLFSSEYTEPDSTKSKLCMAERKVFVLLTILIMNGVERINY